MTPNIKALPTSNPDVPTADRSPVVLHVLGTLDRAAGGPITTTSGQIELCRQNGVATAVVSFGRAEENPFKGVQVQQHHSPLRFARALRAAVRGADVVHVHGMYRLHTYTAAFYALRHRRRLVVEPHGSLTIYQRRKHRIRKIPFELLLDGPILARSEAVVVASSMERRELLLRFCARCTVVPHSLRVAAGKESDHGAPRRGVLYLGRLAPKKRLDLLIGAWPRVVEEHPHAVLTIAGPGSADDRAALQRALARLPERSAPSVVYLGPVYGDAKTKLLAEQRVLSLPSEDENFGNVIIEAALSGLQVHTTQNCGATEFLLDDPNAVAIADVDLPAVSAALCSLLSVPDTVAASATASLSAHVTEQLSDANVWQALSSAYGLNGR